MTAKQRPTKEEYVNMLRTISMTYAELNYLSELIRFLEVKRNIEARMTNELFTGCDDLDEINDAIRTAQAAINDIRNKVRELME